MRPRFFRKFLKEHLCQILKCKDTSFRNWSSQNEVIHVHFYKTYTAKAPLPFLEECLCATWLKHVTVIDDCDNVIFIATSIHKVMLTKKWDVINCKIKVSKSFTQSEKLRWNIFSWYLINAFLNKHLLVVPWHVIFY